MRFAARGLAGGVEGEGVVAHRLAVDQMALDDLLEHLRRAGVIPDAVGIDDRDGPVGADAQAVDLAAIDQRLRPGEVERLEAGLEEFPGRERLFARRALRLGLVRAQENVPDIFFQAERGGGLMQFVSHDSQRFRAKGVDCWEHYPRLLEWESTKNPAR